MRALVRAYYASVAWSDHHMGQILALLDRHGLADETLVVYTSDHGESLGEHGQIGKQNFFEGPQRVPLVMRGDGIEAGLQVERVVTHLDLVATLPQLVGLPQMQGSDGRSLLPLLEPEGDAQWEDVALAEMYLGGQNFEEIPGDHLSVMVREGSLKYCEGEPGEYALFDLAEDPGEERDLSRDAAYVGALAALRDRAAEHKPDRFFVRKFRPPGRRKERGG